MRWRPLLARLRDWLLFPFALVVVLLEALYFAVARLVLGAVRGVPGMERWMERAKRFIGACPPAVVLPMFLVPEAISHAAGFLATLLLARGDVVPAVLLAVVVKGGATLATVWIYQAAAPTLLGVAWFARLHGWVMATRQWTLDQIAPARLFLRRLWHIWLHSPGSLTYRAMLRFRTLRARIALWLARRIRNP